MRFTSGEIECQFLHLGEKPDNGWGIQGLLHPGDRGVKWGCYFLSKRQSKRQNIHIHTSLLIKREKLEKRGESKALWVIAIVLAIFLVGGIVVLYVIGEEVETPAQATVTVSEPVDYEGITAIKVTVEGEQSDYNISLTGPDGTEVGSGYILSHQMADGRETVWVPMVPIEEYQTSADPGKYSLLVTDTFGNKVYEEELTYSGASLTVESVDLVWKESIGEYDLTSATLTVSNKGDLLGYVSGVEVSINGIQELYVTEQALVPAGETRSIEASVFLFSLSVEPGTYTATFELKDGMFGGGKTVATYTEVITVP